MTAMPDLHQQLSKTDSEPGCDPHLDLGGELKELRDMPSFLASVERRAYRQALWAGAEQADALDIVQNAMIKLLSYEQHAPSEWPALFQRILQRCIVDHYRQQQRWWRLIPKRISVSAMNNDVAKDGGKAVGEAADTVENDKLHPVNNAPAPGNTEPENRQQQAQALSAIDTAMQALPMRQRQAVLLRAWEQLSVAETAEAMGISEGSVKTHYSRGLKALRTALPELHVGNEKAKTRTSATQQKAAEQSHDRA